MNSHLLHCLKDNDMSLCVCVCVCVQEKERGRENYAVITLVVTWALVSMFIYVQVCQKEKQGACITCDHCLFVYVHWLHMVYI